MFLHMLPAKAQKGAQTDVKARLRFLQGTTTTKYCCKKWRKGSKDPKSFTKSTEDPQSLQKIEREVFAEQLHPPVNRMSKHTRPCRFYHWEGQPEHLKIIISTKMVSEIKWWRPIFSQRKHLRLMCNAQTYCLDAAPTPVKAIVEWMNVCADEEKYAVPKEKLRNGRERKEGRKGKEGYLMLTSNLETVLKKTASSSAELPFRFRRV